MLMQRFSRLPVVLFSLASMAVGSASVVVDVDFEFLSDKIGDADGFDDGDRVQDVSGNGYHGFWGQTGSNVPIVSTPGGTGIDNTSSTGKVFLRDGLTSIPGDWDGGTTTVSPYFTLDGGSSGSGSFTLEAVLNWNNTSSNRNGIMGQASTGNQVWIRESGGYLQYAFGDEGVKDANLFSNTIDISDEKSDGLWHHIGVVYDGTVGEIRTYVDYQLVHTNTDSDIGDFGTLLNNTSDFYLGAYNTTTADQFNGIQDRYRISDQVLTTSEFVSIPEPTVASLALLLGGGLFMRRRR